MRKAAWIFLATSVMGCLVLAMVSINCGGSSGERPGGTGGATSSGGTSTTSSTSTGLDCSKAIAPGSQPGGTPGLVTDFTDWNSSKGQWGNAQGIYGAIYPYKDSLGSSMSAAVDTTTHAFHGTGSVVPSGYGGMGIGFSVCATVTSFTSVSFDIMGSSPGCRMDLQIKTYDQQPNNQNPPGSCDPNGSAGCYNFPAATNAADLNTPIAAFTTVTIPLANVNNWSAANAAQVIGLQWQWGGTNVDLDAGAGCAIDVYVTNVKFQ